MPFCPTKAELEELLAGTLSPADSAALDQHLVECAACRQTLNAVAGGDESWLGTDLSPDDAGGSAYPKTMNTGARRALYDNLEKNHVLALAVDTAVLASRQDDWRVNPFKVRRVRNAIKTAFQEWSVQPRPAPEEGYSGDVQTDPGSYHAPTDAEMDRILELVKNQNEY